MTSKKKILAIIGSPRKGGNTETITDEIFNGAQEQGAETDKIFLNDLSIGFCQACDSCSKNGICKLKDDMTLVNEKISESDVLILGTPVYYWGPTGQFKTFTDRLLAPSRKGILKGKEVIFVVPLGGSEPIARHTVGMLTDSFNYLKMNIFGQIISPQTMEVEDLQQKKDVLQKARELGKEVTK